MACHRLLCCVIDFFACREWLPPSNMKMLGDNKGTRTINNVSLSFLIMLQRYRTGYGYVGLNLRLSEVEAAATKGLYPKSIQVSEMSLQTEPILSLSCFQTCNRRDGDRRRLCRVHILIRNSPLIRGSLFIREYKCYGCMY